VSTAADKVLVTVDGLDGSGKSTFAQRLAAVCGPGALVLAVDDFRLPVDWTRTDRSTLDLYYDERYDLAALEGCIAAFLARAAGCRYRVFDGGREQPGEERPLSFAGLTTLIVEGVFVARLPSAARALSVYLEISHDEARRRVLERDVQKRRTPEEVLRRIETRYFPAQGRYHAQHQPHERAVAVIDNGDRGAPRLLRCGAPAVPGWAPVIQSLLQIVVPDLRR
jgi:uridine kinase